MPKYQPENSMRDPEEQRQTQINRILKIFITDPTGTRSREILEMAKVPIGDAPLVNLSEDKRSALIALAVQKINADRSLQDRILEKYGSDT